MMAGPPRKEQQSSGVGYASDLEGWGTEGGPVYAGVNDPSADRKGIAAMSGGYQHEFDGVNIPLPSETSVAIDLPNVNLSVLNLGEDFFLGSGQAGADSYDGQGTYVDEAIEAQQAVELLDKIFANLTAALQESSAQHSDNTWYENLWGGAKGAVEGTIDAIGNYKDDWVARAGRQQAAFDRGYEEGGWSGAFEAIRDLDAQRNTAIIDSAIEIGDQVIDLGDQAMSMAALIQKHPEAQEALRNGLISLYENIDAGHVERLAGAAIPELAATLLTVGVGAAANAARRSGTAAKLLESMQDFGSMASRTLGNESGSTPIFGDIAKKVLGRVDDVASKWASSGAESALQGARLSEYYRQFEKYGEVGVRELQNGRFRFYGEITPARTPGEMAGARLIREWDPATGATRNWYETLDHAGTVRSVAPKPITEPLNHRMFDEAGNYMGRR
jgi:hypothetical protein